MFWFDNKEQLSWINAIILKEKINKFCDHLARCNFQNVLVKSKMDTIFL